MHKIIKGQFEKRIYKNKFVTPTKGGSSFVVIFREEKTGFTILKFIEDQTEEIYTVKGTFDEIPDGRLELHGDFEEHPSHGESFNVKSYFSLLPEKKEETIEYLSKFLGISGPQATKMWNKYQRSIFDALDEDVNILDDLKDSLFKGEEDGKSDRLNKIKDKWKEESYLRRIRSFLYQYGISEAYSKRIIAQFGASAVNEIKKNPYCLTQVAGIGFLMADKLALNMGIAKESPSRIYAAIIYTLASIAEETGSTYTDFISLHGATLKLLDIPLKDSVFFTYVKDLNQATYNVELDPRIYPQLQILNHGGKLLIFLYQHYRWEEEIAEFLEQHNKPIDFPMPSDEELNEIVQKIYISKGKKVNKLNEKQVAAIKNALGNKISIISGYAGTGKTTIIKVLLEIFKRHNIPYFLLGPTGKSVDVLGDVTEEPGKCSTIHRKIKLLESDQGEETIEELVSITDEYSMVDLRVAYAQFKAMENIHKEQARMIFSGDQNQLNPVGIGRIYIDMIASGKFPVIALTDIYRQSENSSILENCKAVVEGKELNLNDSDDWTTISVVNKTAEEIQGEVLSQIELNGWNNTDIILTSKRSSALGTLELNKRVQDLIFTDSNPLSPYKYEKGLNCFYLGDRVVQTENWYREKDKEIFHTVPYELLLYPEVLTKLLAYCKEERIEHTGLYIEQGTVHNNFMTFGKLVYEDGNIKDIEIDVQKKAKNSAFDINVYNGNWGQVIGLRQEDGTWIIKGENNEVFVKQEHLMAYSFLSDSLKQTTNDKHIYLDECGLSDKFVLLVAYRGKVIGYTRFELPELDLFYASTVHKCQGSQFKRVYAINSSHINYFCDKTWLYTQLSRAESYVVYFSSKEETKKVQSRLFSKNRKGTLLARFKNMRTQEELKKAQDKLIEDAEIESGEDIGEGDILIKDIVTT